MSQTTYTINPIGGAGSTYTTTTTGAGGFGPITVTGAGGLGGSGTISTTTLNGTAGNYITSNGTWGAGYSSIATVNQNANSLEVTGDANFKGDLTIDGISVRDTLKKINERLAILVPDPKKLEQYEALQKAYKNYKMLEALCELKEDDPK